MNNSFISVWVYLTQMEVDKLNEKVDIFFDRMTDNGLVNVYISILSYFHVCNVGKYWFSWEQLTQKWWKKQGSAV